MISRLSQARRSMSVHPFDQVVTYAKSVGHDCERWIHSRAGREKAAVDHVKVVDFMRLAVYVQCRCFGVGPEADGPVLMRHAGKRDAIAHIKIAREDALVTFMTVDRARALLLHQLF